MAAPTRPDPAKLFTREKWIFVPTLASEAAPAAATEVNAATALDISKIMFRSSARPDGSTNMVTPQPRLGDGEQYQFVGTTQRTLGEIRYAFSPQAAASSDGKLAYEKFPEGTTGFLINALDFPVDSDLATGDFVSVYPVEFGPQIEVPEGDGEGAEAAIKQAVAITGPVTTNVALAA